MKIRFKSKIKAIAAFTFAAILLTACSSVVVPGTLGNGIGRVPTGTTPETSATSDPPPTTETSDLPTTDVPTSNPSMDTDSRLSFVAVGDNMIHDAVREDAQKRATGSKRFNFRGMYAGVESVVAAADIAFVNIEQPIAGESFGFSGWPYFNAPEESVIDLIDVGFNVFNINNNHMLDKGTAALASTINYFNSLDDILMIGGYMGAGDIYVPRTMTVNGITVGFISLNYGTNMVTLESEYQITIPRDLADEDFIIDWTKKAAQSCDILVASVHWGVEAQFALSDQQLRVAEIVSEAGADVIIGHHPHVIQKVEWRTNTNGSKTLIAYSLGNFISTQYYDYYMVGGMISFDIVKNASGICSVENVKFMPTMTHYSMNRDGLQVYFLEDYTQELASEHGCVVHSTDFTLQKVIGYVKSNINREFLSDFYR